MLKPPKVGGAAQLRLFVDEIGAERACKVLDIHPSTLRGWLREARPVPQAALQALYWLTSYGFGDACSEAHWSHQFAMYKIRQLEDRLAHLSAPLDPAYVGSYRTSSTASNGSPPSSISHLALSTVSNSPM